MTSSGNSLSMQTRTTDPQRDLDNRFIAFSYQEGTYQRIPSLTKERRRKKGEETVLKDT